MFKKRKSRESSYTRERRSNILEQNEELLVQGVGEDLEINSIDLQDKLDVSTASYWRRDGTKFF